VQLVERRRFIEPNHQTHPPAKVHLLLTVLLGLPDERMALIYNTAHY